ERTPVDHRRLHAERAAVDRTRPTGARRRHRDDQGARHGTPPVGANPARPTGRPPEHRDTDSSASTTHIRSAWAADHSHRPHTPPPHSAMTQPTTGGRPGSEQSTTPSRPNPFRAISFMIVCFPLRIVQFVLLVTGFAIGVATLIIWIGIPILLSVTLLAR